MSVAHPFKSAWVTGAKIHLFGFLTYCWKSILKKCIGKLFERSLAAAY